MSRRATGSFVNAAAAIDLNVARGSASGASVIVLARHFIPPSFAILPLAQSEGAERRQALGCLRGTLRGPVTQARRRGIARVLRPRADRLRSPRAGDARLSALHGGGLLAPTRLGDPFGRCTVSGALRSRIAAFARSARSGGRAVSPDASRGSWLRASPQDAASRSDSGSSPETPSVSGTRGI